MKKKKKAATQKSWIIAALERLQSSPEKLFFVEYGGETLSRGAFYDRVMQQAGYLSANGVKRGTRVILDIDSHVYWQTFVTWCACQVIDAIACIWPPDMRFHHIEEELAEAQKENGFPAPVLVRTPDRVCSWLKNDRDKGIEGRKILYFSGKTENGESIDTLIDRPFPANLEAFENAVATPILPALVEDTAARVYTQGSHFDARPIELSYAHLQDQAEDLRTQFGFDADSRIFIDLHTPHTVVLTLFAVCAQMGAIFCCKAPKFDVLDCLHREVTHAFLLPTSLDSVVKKIQCPEKASSTSKKWRHFCLRAGRFNARHTTHPHWTRSLIDKICVNPVKSENFCDLKAIISYGDHFNAKNAEFCTNLGISVFNAYTTCEFGFVHIHEFMGKGGYLKSVEARIRDGILAVKSHRTSNYVSMDDLVFEDERCGLCTHRSFKITLANGTSVDVSPMREIIARHDIIDEIFIFGQNRPFLTALIYLDSEPLKNWAQSQKIADAPFSELAQNPNVYKYIRGLVDACNLRRSTFECIQKIAVIPKTLSEDPRILTPMGLTRRTTVEHRYASLLDAFYLKNY